MKMVKRGNQKRLEEITKAHTTNTSDFEKPSTITPTSFVNVIPLQTVTT